MGKALMSAHSYSDFLLVKILQKVLTNKFMSAIMLVSEEGITSYLLIISKEPGI